jgi:hypothetical protein
MFTTLIEDLERIQLRLQVEAALNSENTGLSKRLADLAVETNDVLERARQLGCDANASDLLG